ncbi:unnamed protein product [Sphagnum troendelagicum]|uniref:Uncharacterized protein n=1 Tax=Sphagnum troendelagicum TaxID=128251 RepID=A0ABP0UF92_9BRYO
MARYATYFFNGQYQIFCWNVSVALYKLWVTYNRLEVNLSFFLKRHNYKGSISFAVGFCLVLWGWAVVGMLVQEYGS